MEHKPILFVDFDRTLFDTEQFIRWLGEDIEERFIALENGTLPPPDFASMLYPDAIPFLEEARKKYTIVILTYATSHAMQERKVTESGIRAFVDDVIITEGNKGEEAKNYLALHDSGPSMHAFVDDKESNIEDMNAVNPSVQCFLIERFVGENLIERGEGKTSPICITVSNLRQLVQYLK